MKAEFYPEQDVPYFCVVGSPISHSWSPQIHQLFAAQCGLRLTYERVEVRVGELRDAIGAFKAVGGRGMNVTVPLKEEAYRLAERLQPAAAEAGAANTLWFEADGALAADNTDGAGLVRDLVRNLGGVITGMRILMIGAGGAARGVLPMILREAPAEVVLENRNLERAVALARHFAPLGRIGVQPLGTAVARAYDIIVNATSSGLVAESPRLGAGAVEPGTWCYDMMYGADPSPFIREASRLGARLCSDGLGMLIEQAAVAFRIWHGCEPETKPVIVAIRDAMKLRQKK